jgi:hypothetical protein
MIQVGHVARVEQIRNAYKVLIWKNERKVAFWKSRRRCENNIEMYLENGVWEFVLDLSGLAWGEFLLNLEIKRLAT